MPNIRIGFSSDFVLKNGVVGLGTTVGSTSVGKLDLGNGDLRANFSVSGVATLTAYGGFVAQKQHVNKPAAIGFSTVGVGTYQQYYETTTEFTDLGGVHHGDDQYFNTLSEDLIIDDGQILNITNTAMSGVTTIGQYDAHTHQSYVCAGSLEQVSVTEHFSVPCGGTNERQVAIEGTVRFNDDLNTLEFFNGVEWRQFTYNQGQSGRGLFGGGTTSDAPNGATAIEYIQIQTTGNSQQFGELTVAAGFAAAVSSSTRGIWGSRYTGSGNNTIDYVTIPSQGNAIDFGNSTGSLWSRGGLSSSTRGIFFGGQPASNVIEYIEMDTLGDAIDFGDLMSARRDVAGFASATRGIMAGGNPGIGADHTVIESITISSKGNSTRFGEKDGLGMMSGSANATRGLFAGGSTTPTLGGFSNIDFVTIASEGNAVNFGDLTLSTYRSCAMASQTRAVFAHGTFTPGSGTRTSMDYITIASQGDAIDFGDKSETREYADGGCSDSHGGLGGF